MLFVPNQLNWLIDVPCARHEFDANPPAWKKKQIPEIERNGKNKVMRHCSTIIIISKKPTKNLNDKKGLSVHLHSIINVNEVKTDDEKL